MTEPTTTTEPTTEPTNEDVITLPKTVTDLDSVDANFRGLYVQSGDSFKFEGHQVTGLRTKNEQLLAEKKQASQKVSEWEQKYNELSESNSGSVDEQVSAWETKHNKVVEDYKTQLSQKDNAIENLTIKAIASSKAAEIAVEGSATVLEPHILQRLRVDWQDNQPVVKVLNAKGELTHDTVDDLVNEFKNTPAFAPLISGSKATGGNVRQPKESTQTTKGYTKNEDGQIIIG